MAAALAVCLALPAAAATFTANPAADAFVTTGSTATNLSGNNYGAAGALSVAAPGLPEGEFQSVMMFNLSGLPNAFNTQYGAGQWSIQSVTLQLTATKPNNGIFNASAAGMFAISWMQNTSWTEGTGTPMAPTSNGITFNTLSNYVGSGDESLGTFSYNGSTSATLTYTLNLPSGFSAAVAAGDTIGLRFYAADTAVSFLFDSENNGGSGTHPLLTVAVPEPDALCLGLAATAPLAALKRRARRTPA
jgi:hypothetical protein